MLTSNLVTYAQSRPEPNSQACESINLESLLRNIIRNLPSIYDLNRDQVRGPESMAGEIAREAFCQGERELGEDTCFFSRNLRSTTWPVTSRSLGPNIHKYEDRMFPQRKGIGRGRAYSAYCPSLLKNMLESLDVLRLRLLERIIKEDKRRSLQHTALLILGSAWTQHCCQTDLEMAHLPITAFRVAATHDDR